MTCLLLRPKAKYLASAAAFNDAGVDAVGVAVIDTVVDQPAVAALPGQLAALPADGIIIVVSTTAAKILAEVASSLSDEQSVIAVGPSSASILSQAGIAALQPQQANSEGVLAMAAVEQITGKQVLILKGQGGRPLLEQALSCRGAEVTCSDLYQRQRLKKPVASAHWHPDQIHCIIATSGEIIEAAFDCFDPAWLKTQQWIVVSQRTGEIATKLGVTQVSISDNATDPALIQCVKQLAE